MARVQYVKDPRGPGLGRQILRSAGFRAYLCVNAQFTNDGKALVVFSHLQVFRWQHCEIAELQKHTLSADACFDTSIHSLLPTHSRLYSVVPDILEDEFSLLHAWNPLTAQS